MVDGRHVCDRCGTDVGNGGVAQAVVVSDLDPNRPGMIRNLHYCRDRVEEAPDGARTSVQGCGRELLSPEMLAAYNARQESSDGS